MKIVGKLLAVGALFASIGSVAAGESFAALDRIDGSVLVNQGEQYVSAREGMGLKTGDRLMVMSGASVVISYADGCRYNVGENRVLTIGEASICGSEANNQHVGPSYAAIGGAATMPAWVVPTSIVGTITVSGAALDTGSDSNRNISP